MPAICRLGDSSAGHGCFPARPNDQASATNVLINGLPVHLEGDHWEIHCCGPVCHDGVLQSGSGKVFINGKAVGRVGDPISCGDTVAQGSPNVFSG